MNRRLVFGLFLFLLPASLFGSPPSLTPSTPDAVINKLKETKDAVEIDALMEQVGADLFTYSKLGVLLFDEKVSIPVKKAIAVTYVAHSIDTGILKRVLLLAPDANSEMLKLAVFDAALQPGSKMGLAIDDVKTLVQRGKDSEKVLGLARKFLKVEGQ